MHKIFAIFSYTMSKTGFGEEKMVNVYKCDASKLCVLP